MPRYFFLCECGQEARVLRPAEKRCEPQVCKCGKAMKRNPQGASSKIVETRDNGLMSRRVEQPADVERLMYERAHRDPNKDREP